MNFVVLNVNKAPEEQLLKAIIENEKAASHISTKIKDINELLEKSKKYEEPSFEYIPKKIPSASDQPENIKDEVFYQEYLYYYDIIKSLSADEIDTQLNDIMQIDDSQKNKKILYRIQLEILRSIKEIKTFIATEDLSSSDIELLEEEIKNEKSKIRVIAKHLGNPMEEEKTLESNNLIFAPTIKGNIGVIVDLDQIDQEFYSDILMLLNSIKIGTFINETNLSSDCPNIQVVSNSKIQIAFSKLTDSSYSIIGISKNDPNEDKKIDNSLYIRCLDYEIIENKLRLSLENDKFIQLNSQYEEEIINKISPQKHQVKNKVGDK